MDKIEKSHKFGQSFGKIWSTVFSINYHMCIFCILFCFDCLLLIFFLFFPSVFIHSSRAPSISIEDLKVACGIFQRSDIQVYSTSQSQLPPSTLAQGGQSSVSNPPRACVAWKLGTSVVSQYIGGEWKRERRAGKAVVGLMALGSWQLVFACPRRESWRIVVAVLHSPRTHGARRLVVGLFFFSHEFF